MSSLPIDLKSANFFSEFLMKYMDILVGIQMSSPGERASNSWNSQIQVYNCVFGPAFKARTRINFLHFKVRTFWQSEVKISVLALWLCALSSLFYNMGVGGGYGRNPLFVRARHVQRCVKKCPHFECVIHRFVLALNAWTSTLYTRVYIVSSLWVPGQVCVCVGVCGGGGCVCVCVCVQVFIIITRWHLCCGCHGNRLGNEMLLTAVNN